MEKIISLLTIIKPSNIYFVDSVIQALVLEIAMFTCIPLLGIVIDSIVVKGMRGTISKVLGYKIEYFFTNYFLFVGVIIHELSHALLALITGAKINKVAIFRPEGDSLGYVDFSPRGSKLFQSLQLSLSSCAPVLIGMIITLSIITKAFPILSKPWQWAVFIYLFLSVLFHMNMSKADLKCYFKGALPVLLIGFPICLILVLVY